MMKLYWSPRSRSFSALWLMEETGQPYERVLTDISTGAQKTLEFLSVNPMGKVPALQDGEATLAEAAAQLFGAGRPSRIGRCVRSTFRTRQRSASRI
ncbi:MAG: glutathione S-transferase-like protein [Tardiphaga sp.]|nr:glutathione S-transferase-like protein [Tardiphaga sp.]